MRGKNILVFAICTEPKIVSRWLIFKNIRIVFMCLFVCCLRLDFVLANYSNVRNSFWYPVNVGVQSRVADVVVVVVVHLPYFAIVIGNCRERKSFHFREN